MDRNAEGNVWNAEGNVWNAAEGNGRNVKWNVGFPRRKEVGELIVLSI